MAPAPQHSHWKRITQIALWVIVVWGVAPLARAQSAAEAADPMTTRLRVAWGGGEPTEWRGRLYTPSGELTRLQPLGAERDSPGAVWLEGGEVRIESPSPRGRDALDITVAGPPDTRLVLELTPPGGKTRVVESTVGRLRSGSLFEQLDDLGNRALIHRAADDKLRIKTDRESLVFNPGEDFRFELIAAIDGLAPGGATDVEASLGRGRAGPSVWTQPASRLETPTDGGPPRLELSVPLPSEEGVYRLELRATRPAGFTDRFRPNAASRVLAARVIQLVVFDRARRPAPPSDWRQVYAFHPGSPRWRDRLPDWVGWRRLPWFSDQPIGSGPAAFAAGGEGERFALLPPTDKRGQAHWQAYPLPVARPNTPHVVEVDYPTDRRQRLTISVADLDAGGRVSSLTAGATIEIDRWSVRPGIETARYLFWPRTSSPLLVVSNGAEGDARYSSVRLLEGVPGEALDETPASDRLIALHAADADLPRLLGASLAMAADGGYLVEDTQTWFEAAERLADRVQLAGANGAVVAVAGDGGSLYKSRVFGAAPRYDRRAWESGVDDARRVEPLDLLLNAFDRRGLRLVPEIAFDGVLPRLERMRREAGGDDRVATVTDPVTGANVYDATSDAVAKEMLAAVEEVASRFAGRTPLTGVAVRLGDRGHAVLASEACGLGRESVDRFLAEHGLAWPEGAPRTQASHAELIFRSQRQPWLAWRVKQIDRLYAAMADRLAEQNEQASLILVGDGLLDRPRLRAALRPRLGQAASPGGALEAYGIQGERLAERAMVASPALIASHEAAAERAIASAWLASDESSAGFNAACLAGRRQTQTLKNASDLPRFGAGGDVTVECVEATPHARRGFYADRLLGGADGCLIDGGAAIEPLLDAETIRLRRLLASSPPGSADARAVMTQQPLSAVALASKDGQATTLCVINESPWPCEAGVTIEAPRPCRANSPSGDSLYDAFYDAGRHALSLTLPAYGTHTYRFTTAGVKPIGVRAKPDPRGRETLVAALADLQSRDQRARSSFDAIPDPSFESPGPAEGAWPVALSRENHSAGVSDIDATDGDRCLRLMAAPSAANAGAAAVVVGPHFPTPATGQLAIVFQAKPRSFSPDSELVVSFERPGGGYRSETVLGAAQLAPGPSSQLHQPQGVAPSDEAVWRPFVFAVDDLPLDGGPLRLRFELRGTGDVCIDDLQADQLILPLEFYAEDLKPQKLALVRAFHAAEAALEEGRLVDCLRVLDSYWPQFVVRHFPPAGGVSGVASRPPVAPGPVDGDPAVDDSENAEAEEAETPSIGERLWRYLPGFVR
ncbi:hypothetical protein [Pseudobythopirellula maris]|nr:hypothetical protein [Pseudobythopirellula maris]